MYKYVFAFLFVSFQALAVVPVDGMVSVCKTYPEIDDPTSFPKHFNSTNNLSRPADSGFYEAEGEKITIYGRILDSNCVPINDVTVYIWQANKAGYVQYPIKTPNHRHHHQKWVDPNFDGTGTTHTDNLGRFNFTTIKPGSFTKVTPHIHLMIKHPKFHTLKTKFYFPKAGAKEIIDTTKDDNVFTITKKEIIDQVSAVPGVKPHTYTIDITMNEDIKEKGF